MNYREALQELCTTATKYKENTISLEDYVNFAKELVTRLNFTPMLIPAPKKAGKKLRKDKKARELLGNTYSEFCVEPIETLGDGNCLYNAVSIALRGDESLAQEFRLRTSLELLVHFDYYKETYKDDLFLCTDPLEEDCVLVCQNRTFSSAWAIAALASVIRVGIRSVYPKIDDDYNKKVYPLLNKLFPPRKGIQDGGVIVMWTRSRPLSDKLVWSPDHFVAILPKKNLEGEKFYRAKCLPLLNNTTERFDKMVACVDVESSDGDFGQPAPLFTGSLPTPFNYLPAGITAVWNKVKVYLVSLYFQAYNFLCFKSTPARVPMIGKGKDHKVSLMEEGTC